MSPPAYHLIGDVHGCRLQLEALFSKLGYQQLNSDPDCWLPPDGVQTIFLGDLVDRGPDSLGALAICKAMVQSGVARWVLGNHELRLRHVLRYLLGKTTRPVRLSESRLLTWVQALALEQQEMKELLRFIDKTPPYLELVPGELIAVHARWEAHFPELDASELLLGCAAGDSSTADSVSPDDEASRQGELTRLERGLIELPPSAPLAPRARWVRDWAGPETVVWGHHVVKPGRAVRIGRTLALDSGCCNGYALSAYLWPEGELVQVDGGEPWRQRHRRYQPVGGRLFPGAYEAVSGWIEREQLDSAEAYVARLNHKLAENRIPPMWPALEAAHVRIYQRLAERHGW